MRFDTGLRPNESGRDGKHRGLSSRSQRRMLYIGCYDGHTTWPYLPNEGPPQRQRSPNPCAQWFPSKWSESGPLSQPFARGGLTAAMSPTALPSGVGIPAPPWTSIRKTGASALPSFVTTPIPGVHHWCAFSCRLSWPFRYVIVVAIPLCDSSPVAPLPRSINFWTGRKERDDQSLAMGDDHDPVCAGACVRSTRP
jgi:hypothetical protein